MEILKPPWFLRLLGIRHCKAKLLFYNLPIFHFVYTNLCNLTFKSLRVLTIDWCGSLVGQKTDHIRPKVPKTLVVRKKKFVDTLSGYGVKEGLLSNFTVFYFIYTQFINCSPATFLKGEVHIHAAGEMIACY